MKVIYLKETIRENLLMGNMQATDNQLCHVLEKVNIKDFLKEKKGLESEIAEKGNNFSGGQRQRIALARALLHNSSIYIFDEATSKITAESEADIVPVILELAKEKTVILISHRLANVVDADQIVVMKKGIIVEKGNHQNLIQQKSYYYELYKEQERLESYGRKVDNNGEK